MGPKHRPYSEVEHTVRRYESFVEEKLKPDLLAALNQRNKVGRNKIGRAALSIAEKVILGVCNKIGRAALVCLL